MKKIFLVLSFSGLCLAVDVAAESVVAAKLDEAIIALDAAAISDALGRLEQARQKVPLLPRLQKLQAADMHKRHWAQAFAWPVGAVSSYGVGAGLTLGSIWASEKMGYDLHGFVDKNVRSSSSKLVFTAMGSVSLTLFSVGPLAVYATYKAWVRRMRVRTIAPIVRILFTSKVLTFGDDGEKIGAILESLGIKA